MEVAILLHHFHEVSFNNTLPVKNDLQTNDESFEDELYHMSLRDRVKLSVPREAPT